jgi:hypothetical protein
MMIELITALVNLQSELPEVEKDQIVKGKAFSFKFASYTEIVRVCKPLLKKHGFAIVHVLQGDNVVTNLYHVSGDNLESSTGLVFAPDDIQDKGGAISYLKRHQYAGIIGLAISDDDDADTKSGGTNEQRPQYQTNSPDPISEAQVKLLVFEKNKIGPKCAPVFAQYGLRTPEDLAKIKKSEFNTILAAVRKCGEE